MAEKNIEFNDSVENQDLSMREKSLLKRTINKHHNNNFSAGYVPVHEESLHKTGLRGRKTYFFWTFIGLLCALALANTTLNIIIFRVLRIGYRMESIELFPEVNIVKFFGNTDLGILHKADGNINGYLDENLDIVTAKGSISFDVDNIKTKTRSNFRVVRNGTSSYGVNFIEIKNPLNRKMIFSTLNPNFKLTKSIKNLESRTTQTRRISSAVDEKLILKSDSYLKLRGSEGFSMLGKEILFTADQNIDISSLNGSIFIKGKSVYIDIKSLPVVDNHHINHGLTLIPQYKVCACNTKGKLYQVHVTNEFSSACHYNESVFNPCM